MKKRFTLHLSGIFLLLLFAVQDAKACHGLALVSPTFTTNASDVTINASSDAASCGCGPYFMEVEVVPTSGTFSGLPPVWTSGLWGIAPWFHSLLNVPNYTAANGWPDNCVQEPYTAVVIPFALLCTGTSFKVRAREYVAGSGSAGPWTAPYTFTTPGSPITATVIGSASPYSICQGDSTLLNAVGSGCIGNYTYSWSPATGLSNPNSAVTVATPTVTTTYTVTFNDLGLLQVATDTVTVVVNSLPSVSLQTMIESTCNGSNGSATISVSGGTPPYSYSWSPSGGTGATESNLASGAYTAVVTDTNNCATAIPVVVGDSCDFVWPGDANDDAVANNFDILDIGIANGATGPSRPNASLTWIGQPSLAWGFTLSSGTDYKWVDCNGDGYINSGDTTAVVLNYGYTHNNRYGAPVYNATAPPLALDLVPDSLVPSSAGTVVIDLGDNATQANGVYGIAFTIHFDATQVNPNSLTIDLSNSWMGTWNTNLIAVTKVNGSASQIDIAITRMDHADQNGMGEIARLHFMTTNALTGTGTSQTVPFTITDVRMNSANGTLQTVNPVNDTLVVYDPVVTGINAGDASSQLQIVPNPSTGMFSVQYKPQNNEFYTVEIINELGQTVSSESFSPYANGYGAAEMFDLSKQGAGIYTVRVISEHATVTKKIIVR